MSAPMAIRVIADLALSSRANLLAGIQGRVLVEDSLVAIYANQEAVTGEWQVTIGSNQALPAASPATLNATVGVMPIVPDDLLVATTGDKGQEIEIIYFNADLAAAREGRLIVQIVPIAVATMVRALAAAGVPVPQGLAAAVAPS